MVRQNDWKLSVKVCRESIRKLSGDARIAAIIILVSLFEWVLIEALRTECVVSGLSISSWFFVFLFDGIQALFYYFGVLLLFCDAPFADNQQMDVILRVGKKNWFRGKILYIFTASILYFLLLYVISIVEFIPYVGFSLNWEEFINMRSLKGDVVIRRVIVSNYKPLEAFGVQMIVCILFAVFLGLIIFFFNMYKNKTLGAGIALVMVLMDTILNLVDLGKARLLVYFIPMAWTDIAVYKKETGGVPFWYPVTVYCVGIMVLVALIMRKSKSYSIECQEDM